MRYKLAYGNDEEEARQNQRNNFKQKLISLSTTKGLTLTVTNTCPDISVANHPRRKTITNELTVRI